MKNKGMMVLLVAMVIMSGLTACQKTGDGAGQSSGRTEETTEETAEDVTGEKKASDTRPEALQQETQQGENNALAEMLADSPEYQACAEWWDFCESYDTDFAILEQAGNEPVEAGYEYEAYNCYSPEMEKKIDEICEKYGLTKLSGLQIVDDYSELCNKAEVGDFCIRSSENVKQTVLSAWLYDGEFLMEGNAILMGTSICEADYQFSRIEKGCFTSSGLALGGLTEYNAREYTTKKGEKVYFANVTRTDSGTNTYIVVEREKSFIVINILGDMSDVTDVNDERLELLADAFDFAAIP